MIRIPLYLEIAQWALLLGLGTLVIVLYRQLGRLLTTTGEPRRPARQSAAKAAPIRYARIPADSACRLTPGDGQPALIAFVDPTCPACEQLVASLASCGSRASSTECAYCCSCPIRPGYLRYLCGVPGDEPGDRPSAQRRRRSAGTGSTGTPLLVAVDRGGVVRAAGVTSKLTEVRAHAAMIVRESEAAR